MSRFIFPLIVSFGLSAPALAQSQFTPSDIQTDSHCEAAFGIVSSIDGAMTCTLPVMDSYEVETDAGVASCQGGELVSGGTFCRVIIDDEYKNAEPDCEAIEGAKAASPEGYDEWLVQVNRLYTDAWKCEQQ